MLPSTRRVSRLPLDVIWDSDRDIQATRKRWLSKADLRTLLSKDPVVFYLADVGSPLRRIDIVRCYDFWKSEVSAHLVDEPNSGVRPEEFPGQYAYFASEWSGPTQTPIVLLEKTH
jgi:hypothetical protein